MFCCKNHLIWLHVPESLVYGRGVIGRLLGLPPFNYRRLVHIDPITRLEPLEVLNLFLKVLLVLLTTLAQLVFDSTEKVEQPVQ